MCLWLLRCMRAAMAVPSWHGKGPADVPRACKAQHVMQLNLGPTLASSERFIGRLMLIVKHLRVRSACATR